MSYKDLYMLVLGVFSGALTMLVSMLIGEYFFNPQLFGGFSSQPTKWFLVLLESSLWLTPLLVIGWLILKPFNTVKKSTFIMISAFTWATLAMFIIYLYNHFFIPKGYWLSEERFLEVVFGWIIPCGIIWFLNTKFSLYWRH